MIMTRESADDTKEEFSSRRWFVTEFQFVTGDSFCYFLKYLSRFVYGFRVIWNSNSNRVWL